MIRETIVKVFTAIFVIFVLLMAVLSQADFFELQPIPYGVWHSSDPDITIDVTPDSENYTQYYGEYVKDGVIVPIVVLFMRECDEFGIYDISAIEEDCFNGSNPYFYGSWKHNDKAEELKYKLSPYFQERTEYEIIAFEKIESYD